MLSIAVYPKLDAARSGRTIMNNARAALGPGESLGLAGWKEQFLLQWNGPAVHFGYRRSDGAEADDAAAWVAQGERRRLLLPGAMVERCFNPSQLQELGLAHRQHWLLASSASVLPHCQRDAVGPPRNLVRYDPAGQYAENEEAPIRSARRRPATAQ